ncbi:hypothetical protein PCE1_001639 [Barthelona sp. PCE]
MSKKTLTSNVHVRAQIDFLNKTVSGVFRYQFGSDIDPLNFSTVNLALPRSQDGADAAMCIGLLCNSHCIEKIVLEKESLSEKEVAFYDWDNMPSSFFAKNEWSVGSMFRQPAHNSAVRGQPYLTSFDSNGARQFSLDNFTLSKALSRQSAEKSQCNYCIVLYENVRAPFSLRIHFTMPFTSPYVMCSDDVVTVVPPEEWAPIVFIRTRTEGINPFMGPTIAEIEVVNNDSAIAVCSGVLQDDGTHLTLAGPHSLHFSAGNFGFFEYDDFRFTFPHYLQEKLGELLAVTIEALNGSLATAKLNTTNFKFIEKQHICFLPDHFIMSMSYGFANMIVLRESHVCRIDNEEKLCRYIVQIASSLAKQLVYTTKGWKLVSSHIRQGFIQSTVYQTLASLKYGSFKGIRFLHEWLFDAYEHCALKKMDEYPQLLDPIKISLSPLVKRSSDEIIFGENHLFEAYPLMKYRALISWRGGDVGIQTPVTNRLLTFEGRSIYYQKDTAIKFLLKYRPYIPVTKNFNALTNNFNFDIAIMDNDGVFKIDKIGYQREHLGGELKLEAKRSTGRQSKNNEAIGRYTRYAQHNEHVEPRGRNLQYKLFINMNHMRFYIFDPECTFPGKIRVYRTAVMALALLHKISDKHVPGLTFSRIRLLTGLLEEDYRINKYRSEWLEAMRLTASENDHYYSSFRYLCYDEAQVSKLIPSAKTARDNNSVERVEEKDTPTWFECMMHTYSRRVQQLLFRYITTLTYPQDGVVNHGAWFLLEMLEMKYSPDGLFLQTLEQADHLGMAIYELMRWIASCDIQEVAIDRVTVFYDLFCQYLFLNAPVNIVYERFMYHMLRALGHMNLIWLSVDMRREIIDFVVEKLTISKFDSPALVIRACLACAASWIILDVETERVDLGLLLPFTSISFNLPIRLLALRLVVHTSIYCGYDNSASIINFVVNNNDPDRLYQLRSITMLVDMFEDYAQRETFNAPPSQTFGHLPPLRPNTFEFDEFGDVLDVVQPEAPTLNLTHWLSPFASRHFDTTDCAMDARECVLSIWKCISRSNQNVTIAYALGRLWTCLFGNSTPNMFHGSENVQYTDGNLALFL